MKNDETELEMVRRHVCDGKLHVARQQGIVAKLREAQSPLELAKQTLATFEALQRKNEAHLSRLTANQTAGAVPDM